MDLIPFLGQDAFFRSSALKIDPHSEQLRTILTTFQPSVFKRLAHGRSERYAEVKLIMLTDESTEPQNMERVKPVLHRRGRRRSQRPVESDPSRVEYLVWSGRVEATLKV